MRSFQSSPWRLTRGQFLVARRGIMSAREPRSVLKRPEELLVFVMSKLCALLGHRRHKGRARPYAETWRSECTRCKIPMVRSAPGLWTAAPKLTNLHGSRPPQAKAVRDPFSVKQGETSVDLAAAGVNVAHLPLPEHFASSILGSRSHQADEKAHYLRRGAECRRLAAETTDPTIELIHLDMANRYDVLARQSDLRQANPMTNAAERSSG